MLKYVAIAFIPAIVISGVMIQSASPTNALENNERLSRIKELTKKIDASVQSSRSLNKQSTSISSQLDAMKRERNYLNQQIANNDDEYSSVLRKIEQSKKSIKEYQDALGEVMVSSYLDGSISPIEMLASSESVAGYFDRLTLQESLSDQLSKSVNNLQVARKELIAQETELAQVIGNQKNQQIALAKKTIEQNDMLVATTDKTVTLEKITAKMARERRELQNTQQESLANALVGAEMVTSGSISEPVTGAPQPKIPAAPTPSSQNQSGKNQNNTDTSVNSSPKQPTKTPATNPKPTPPVVLQNGGYPSSLMNCYVDANALSYGIDPWGYGCRQCVSYTAWKVLQKTGNSAMYWGNAKDWPSSARRVGYQTGTTPKRKSIAVVTSGPYGHVAWVEKVNPNGTINISQYNYWLPGKANGGWGWYSEFRNVSPNAYNEYIYM